MSATAASAVSATPSGTAPTNDWSTSTPFFDLSGRYELRFSLGEDVVATTVVLRQGDQIAFTATFRGRPQPATQTAVLTQLIRRPLMTQRVSALIRLHGIRLWLRGLPIRPRPAQLRQEGV